MHGATLIRDLAVVMIVSGITTLVFRRLKQPVVLGYLLAGFLVGPHILPAISISDLNAVHELAELGLLFLMFSLGLDFSLRKLREVGTTAGLAAVVEIAVMVGLGFVVAGWLGWSTSDRLLLGAGLAISSTAIIIKSLRDSGQLKSPHGELVAGLLVVEDIFIILVMAFLPGFASHASVGAGALALTLLKLFVVLVAAIVVGLLAVPRLLLYVSRIKSDEMLLVTVLGLAFGFAQLMAALNFSTALGAFLMGALVAESRALGRVRDLTEPLRDMFSAVFFVSIGMLIDPSQIVPHAGEIALLTVVFMLGKTIACSLGLFMTGNESSTSMRAGLHMAQLGEFAFVVATLGVSLGLGSDKLFPVVVAVAALNAVARPYLVDRSDAVIRIASRLIPARLRSALVWYNRSLGEIRDVRRGSAASRIAWSLLMQIAITAALIAAVFLVASFLAPKFPVPSWAHLPDAIGGGRPLWWLGALVLSMPMLIASHRKIEALAMLLSEMVTPRTAPHAAVLRPLIARTLHVVGLLALGMLVLVLSATFLPPATALVLLLVAVMLLGWLFGRSFNAWYSRAKFSLVDTWNQPPHREKTNALPPQLTAAELELFEIVPGPNAGKLIRELNLRARTGVSIVALERAGKSIVNPGPDEELQAGDKILLLGEPAQLQQAITALKNVG